MKERVAACSGDDRRFGAAWFGEYSAMCFMRHSSINLLLAMWLSAVSLAGNQVDRMHPAVDNANSRTMFNTRTMVDDSHAIMLPNQPSSGWSAALKQLRPLRCHPGATIVVIGLSSGQQMHSTASQSPQIAWSLACARRSVTDSLRI